MRQWKNESLKSYLARFTEEMHNCKNITEVEMFTTFKEGLDVGSMFWRDVRNWKPRDYNALVDLINEEIISKEMARARDNHAQQCYNHRGHTNVKSTDGRPRH
ncbi:Uncharacterized protein Adt_03056 [Abeliophyllum distichum]|uniref:Retrotransposon gag domain-containing protein n=1 Tax=Abeliophyllum distichum TaxID=126358 RepID=A0ABD1VZK2_9LAMI